MARDALKLVRDSGFPPTSRGRAAALALGALVLAAGASATLLGADRARNAEDPAPRIEQAREALLDGGSRDPRFLDVLVGLRRDLGARPLDSRTRARYASLLLVASWSAEDASAAAFHARVAARLAPVTVSVVRDAATILARAGAGPEALDWTREMFLYDPPAAARLLLRLETALTDADPEAGLAETPDAWLAWSEELRRAGLEARADDWLVRAHERWPAHGRTLEVRAARAVRRDEAGALDRVFPPERELPDSPEVAPTLLYRAMLRAREGDAAGARADVARAQQLDPASPVVRVLAGEALAELGADAEARTEWERALFLARDDGTRKTLLPLLARLADRQGEPGAALRHWRALLELEPEHPEARRRIDDLSGFAR